MALRGAAEVDTQQRATTTLRARYCADVALEFSGPIWYWRGPAPHHFVTVPPAECELLREVSRVATYGWGMIPVEVTIDAVSWETSLFPKDGAYVVPVKAAVRTRLGVAEGDIVTVRLAVASRGGRLLLDRTGIMERGET